MAITFGVCPHCGEIVRVNDEKQSGFCAKCGQQLDVWKSIQAYQLSGAQENTQTQACHQASPVDGPGVRPETAQKRQDRAQAAEAKVKSAEASKKISVMFQMCSSEQDFLMIRAKVLEMKISDDEKAELLKALDAATKARLKDTLELAAEYNESQKSPFSLVFGCVTIAGIGLAINHFTSLQWPGIVAIIIVVVALIGGIGDKLDKKKLAKQKRSAELVNAYRQQGYKI